MPLPNPGMSFTPFDPLPASDLNDMVENIEALQDWSAYDDGTLPSRLIEGASALVFNHVESGCVLTGTGYGSTLAWSLTSGFVWIGGKRLSVGAATGSVTATKDTYFDLLDPGSGSVATLVSTGANSVTVNAASPTLAASSVRIGIIQSGATIASVAAVNQGQTNKLLPIASSLPYQVTDSLGNLICPRDPNRSLLARRQITSNFVSATGNTQGLITGLTAIVNFAEIPIGRKYKAKIWCMGISAASNGNSFADFAIWDGTVGSGTKITSSQPHLPTSATSQAHGIAEAEDQTTATTAKTFNGAVSASNTNNATVKADATFPAFIEVRLD